MDTNKDQADDGLGEETIESFMSRTVPEPGDAASFDYDGKSWTIRHHGVWSYADGALGPREK